MKPLFLFGLLFLNHISFGQIDTTFGKPIFWYRVSDPWGMFMGSEGPTFILYDMGRVLFWKHGNYYTVRLNTNEKLELINQLNLRDTIFETSRYYNATNPDPNGDIMATDNPSYTVWINFDTLVHVSVYGNISSKEYRKRFPSQILKIHEFILKYEADEPIKWIPNKVEVMLSDYSHSTDSPIQWPSAWPDLNSPDTRKHESSVTSIFLDKKYLSQLKKLIKSRREKQAFQINDRKFFIGYRFPIPGLY